MAQVVIAVILSVLISAKLTSMVCLKLFEEVLNTYENYCKKIVVNEVMIRSILSNKDKQQLLELYDETIKEIEEGADE